MEEETQNTTLIPGYGAWVKTQGIFYIIIGGSYSLSIIGAIIGVPFIFAGVKLLKSAEIASEIDLKATDEEKVEQLISMGENLKDGLKIYIITMIATFALSILAFILIIVAAIVFAATGPRSTRRDHCSI